MKAGENLAHMHWEGFKRTASDELYHAVWANTSGERGISLPFAAKVVEYNPAALEDPYKVIGPSPEGWLVRVEVTSAELTAAPLLDQADYVELCEREEELEDAGASVSGWGQHR